MAQDYWWVTRPKRRLNTIPEELAAFCTVAYGKKWTHNRNLHIAFEEELEKTETKRVGERRDASGSGGRTHAAMLFSLGLWFEKNETVYLTLAGEAIMSGKSPVEVLKKQVLDFQYPSAYASSVRISDRFHLRPFVFLLKVLADSRIGMLTQEEIAFVILIQAENDNCLEQVIRNILIYREAGIGWNIFGDDYLSKHGASEGNLMDVANTMMNWLDYTRLVFREKKTIGISKEKIKEVINIIQEQKKLISYPDDKDIFQRKYGVDPWHQKDTRNLLKTDTITTQVVESNRILREFFNYASIYPIRTVTRDVVDVICNKAGTEFKLTETVLLSKYPNGSLDSYLINYRNMAFKGREEAVDFEIATTNLFADILGYKAVHLGQTGSKSAPDILIISESEKYQAIIDNKAYSNYSISGDHHNRMVHNYIAKLSNYSSCDYPLAFFSYISGGFGPNIDKQIASEASESGVNGSAISVDNVISLVTQRDKKKSHSWLRDLFGINRQILLSDIYQ